MDNLSQFSTVTHGNAFSASLSIDTLRERVPAVFAPSAHEKVSPKYTFIPTERVLTGLMQVGFVAVDARQAQTRKASLLHTRHVIRLRRRMETVSLRDSIPEVVLWNAHDGTGAYQIRLGCLRVVCLNGLIVSLGAFPSVRVAHRGDIVEEVVTSALELAERFGALAAQVERMEKRQLQKEEQIQFAERALAIRFPEPAHSGLLPAQLLTCRRVDDVGNDLWTCLNKVQENLLRGGLSRRTASGRRTRTRAITSIAQDMRINGRIWDLAEEVLAA
jgi:hypothetical protein